MKSLFSLIFFQLILSVIAAYFLSEMSWVGKIGISVFYKEYSILKNPVQSGSMIFAVELMVILVLSISRFIGSKKVVNFIAFLFFLVGLAGLLYSMYDFSENFSHKILKEKFHFGIYLIWVGIMISCLYFWMKPKQKSIK